MGPRAGLDILEKSKISCPYRDSNPAPSSSFSLYSVAGDHVFESGLDYEPSGVRFLSVSGLSRS